MAARGLQETPMLMEIVKTTVTTHPHCRQTVRAGHGAADGETQTMNFIELFVHGIAET